MSHLRSASLFSVAGKRVLLTGGGRGIGKMMATGLVANGARVAIASRNQAALDEVVAELRGLDGGGECVALRADLSTRAGCEQLAADFAASSLGGHCDVLVNNSGVSWGEPLARESGRMNWGWDRVLDLNVKAPFYLTRAMLPQLGAAAADGADAGDPARVINVGSIAGVLPQDVPTHAYDISKAAIHHLTRKLAAELATPQPGAARAVAVNAIAPGFVPTKMSKGLATWGADEDVLASKQPLGRCGGDADMAGAVLSLASPAASWMTGVILPVDGGATGAARVEVLPDE